MTATGRVGRFVVSTVPFGSRDAVQPNVARDFRRGDPLRPDRPQLAIGGMAGGLMIVVVLVTLFVPRMRRLQ
ncbi:MAG: hypothetical protein C4558_06065 [Dehalococcoidia bacterium]|nr:MAG: hypothetical protein C4558_06065 [Dehalococcoidia bacterium]